MNHLTPREIVAELDRYIVGQQNAKRLVAIAVRNRWRRQQIDPAMRDEIAPKNIILMGPTGVGKTEIARRLAKLSGSPFIKVEATKYTEVGYVGRDVESMVRDLLDLSISLMREEETVKVQAAAEHQAEERLLDLLLPPPPPPVGSLGAPSQDSRPATREKLRALWQQGHLDDKEVEVEVEENTAPKIGVLSIPGADEMGTQFQDMLGKIFPSKRKKRRMKVPEAYPILLAEASNRLVDNDALIEAAKMRMEQTGIIFIDEIDKIANSNQQARSSDISREGVQRDLLPIVEGSAVNTKYGMVRTDHILFIAAGAFHFSKPSDLIPELQGRFPLRSELAALSREDFYRILTEPNNALTHQYIALLATEGVTISFTDDSLREIAAFAEEVNQQTENIGARRLYTILEKILSDLSFDAPERSGETVVIDTDYVREHIADVRTKKDLSRYIL
jgi:ATP-dependent HslUV protease ATP-binding subunit HslU